MGSASRCTRSTGKSAQPILACRRTTMASAGVMLIHAVTVPA
ncbi:hypothetical protein QJS83_14880 [Bdellovibrio sp. 22V]|nr:hypothetical protein [Bdellovibrio sp. 22V]WII71747.1 hypothetical protein QJS83_14880 [Bdellovibrio sp. 22V]